ncbi:hypothetical protein [Micromonospora sp. NPDC047134]|uniref:hypothetical protein n=1 Tax=Micromonospora sp. NPDC047134 TaxID=3154340 RepID=UPI0033D5B52E
MNETYREIYGISVHCVADPRAATVVDAFFGAPVAPRADAPSLRLAVRVADHPAAATAEPPHTEEVIAADPIIIDTGGSRCEFDVAAGVARVTLCAADLTNPIVWGRWIFERLALYLVCRSSRLYPLHAGAFVADGHAVLVSGPTGMGKSTFVHTALRHGAELVGEDIMVRDLRDEVPGRLWGYPQALYVTPERLAGNADLAQAVTAPVNDGEKLRVTISGPLTARLRSSVVPDSVVFLSRGDATIRPLTVDEAVQRCRDDFATGKADPVLLGEIEDDLRSLLADRLIWELAMSSDLDASYDRLLDMVRSLAPTN